MKSISSKTTILHNGVEIPSLGYRVDRDNKEAIYQNVRTAVDAGFRHFDLPADSESEKLIGQALQDSGVPRNDLFLTYKVRNENHSHDLVLRGLDQSLKRTGTDYADLVLVNWPNPIKFRDDYEHASVDTWRGLETAYKKGTARAIGLANFHAHHIEHILEAAEISPMANQARIYPGFPFENNLNCADSHSIQTIGFLPPHHDDILNSRELQIFAEKYGVTPRHICVRYLVRYLLEKGCLALCQGSDLQELIDCEKAFNFTLTEDEMKFLDLMKNYGLDMIDPDTCDF